MSDDASYLIDIVHYGKAACRFVGDMTRHDFERDELVFLATQKALEVIGEASNKLTPAFRAKNPNVEWGKMIAMRNLLVHNYGNVDAVIVWDVVTNKLPVLLEQLIPLVSLSDEDDVGG